MARIKRQVSEKK
jgi:hypothetical protein